jgi:hypothetical protein
LASLTLPDIIDTRDGRNCLWHEFGKLRLRCHILCGAPSHITRLRRWRDVSNYDVTIYVVWVSPPGRITRNCAIMLRRSLARCLCERREDFQFENLHTAKSEVVDRSIAIAINPLGPQSIHGGHSNLTRNTYCSQNAVIHPLKHGDTFYILCTTDARLPLSLPGRRAESGDVVLSVLRRECWIVDAGGTLFVTRTLYALPNMLSSSALGYRRNRKLSLLKGAVECGPVADNKETMWSE